MELELRREVGERVYLGGEEGPACGVESMNKTCRLDLTLRRKRSDNWTGQFVTHVC